MLLYFLALTDSPTDLLTESLSIEHRLLVHLDDRLSNKPAMLTEKFVSPIQFVFEVNWANEFMNATLLDDQTLISNRAFAGCHAISRRWSPCKGSAKRVRFWQVWRSLNECTIITSSSLSSLLIVKGSTITATTKREKLVTILWNAFTW